MASIIQEKVERELELISSIQELNAKIKEMLTKLEEIEVNTRK